MWRFGETKLANEKFYAAKKPKKIWNVLADKIVISKLRKKKTNSKYFVGYLDQAIRPLVFITHTMSEYVKTFKGKDEDKDKNNKLMSLQINDEKFLEKYQPTWIKNGDLKKY